jgi:OOP family OmpA-OmpF porin
MLNTAAPARRWTAIRAHRATRGTAWHAMAATLVLVGLLCSMAAWAQPASTSSLNAGPSVAIQPGRPDEARPRVAEPARYAEVQRRIDKLSAENRPCPVPYHLAKAQAWLNFSRDQFHERVWQGGIRDATFDQSRRIVELLEAGREPPMETPLVSQASPLREDLWRMAGQIKQQVPQHLCCAQKETAFCEVQLVWSGHIVKNVGGWRAAAPHIRQAEDLCQQAMEQRCPAPPPLPPVVLAGVAEPPLAPAPPQPPPPPSYRRITLAAGALFKHNKSAEADLLPEGRAQIKDVLDRLQRLTGVQRVVVTGHADVSNSTGDPSYNQRLSKARAVTVARLLMEGGVKVAAEDIVGMGDAEPETDCPAPKGSDGVRRGTASAAAMQAWLQCLQPNRRVTIEIMGRLEPRR